MKLRVRNNSVRLRLTKSEVACLAETGRVCASTAFGVEPKERLSYALESSDEARSLSARYSDGSITVLLPVDVAKQWVEGEQVGLEGEQALGEGETLKILVEKDFACLTKRDGEEDVDTFPHPQEGMVCA